MASMSVTNSAPSFFVPDASTPNGVYIQDNGYVGIVVTEGGSKKVVTLNNNATPSIVAMGSFGFQLRELSSQDLISITG